MMMSAQCSKHVEAYNKSYYKTRICALSWLITKIYWDTRSAKHQKMRIFSYFLLLIHDRTLS